MEPARMTNFRDFWPYYLSEHRLPLTRALHYLGTSLGLCCVASALFFGNAVFLLAGILSGYFFAWLSHFFIEKNRPATFRYPLWSLFADFYMYYLFITRKLQPHLDKST